jgi:hypothetical protein
MRAALCLKRAAIARHVAAWLRHAYLGKEKTAFHIGSNIRAAGICRLHGALA